MIEDVQNALRRAMEAYSRVTRFFFICNYISRIIEPLASKCVKFRFKPLSEEIMTSRVLQICNEEGLNLDPQALSTLSSISQGDLHRVITYLQGVPPDVVQGFFAACKSGDFELASCLRNYIIWYCFPLGSYLRKEM
ncbi:hypothetical protein GIB67_007609 [Kingdonia uniflora]|uniref:Replication factor C C-terminal domain-containing protein n=1 Tax=Kingdonia uniflora TaxID=39325 RepID=A0A7J7N225_9MAGN|nr:hypothetical protein GIB67_007609 [Kingdonia uniflora]